MATVSLNIDLNYRQVLSLAMQLPSNDRKKLAQQLSGESRRAKLLAIRDMFEPSDATQEEIDAEVGKVRDELYRKRNANNC